MNLGIETEVVEFKKSTGELKDAMDDICELWSRKSPYYVQKCMKKCFFWCLEGVRRNEKMA